MVTIPRCAGDYSLGATSLTTGDSGNVGARQAYTPFGATRWVTGTLPTDFGFTGVFEAEHPHPRATPLR